MPQSLAGNVKRPAVLNSAAVGVSELIRRWRQCRHQRDAEDSIRDARPCFHTRLCVGVPESLSCLPQSVDADPREDRLLRPLRSLRRHHSQRPTIEKVPVRKQSIKEQIQIDQRPTEAKFDRPARRPSSAVRSRGFDWIYRHCNVLGCLNQGPVPPNRSLNDMLMQRERIAFCDKECSPIHRLYYGTQVRISDIYP